MKWNQATTIERIYTRGKIVTYLLIYISNIFSYSLLETIK